MLALSVWRFLLTLSLFKSDLFHGSLSNGNNQGHYTQIRNPDKVAVWSWQGK